MVFFQTKLKEKELIMNFDTVKQIIGDNRMCEPESTDKKANSLAQKAVEQEKNKKPEKKDVLTDMQKLANAKNMVSAMQSKAKQQSDDEPKKKTTKETTKKAPAKKPGRPPKKQAEKKAE